MPCRKPWKVCTAIADGQCQRRAAGNWADLRRHRQCRVDEYTRECASHAIGIRHHDTDESIRVCWRRTSNPCLILNDDVRRRRATEGDRRTIRKAGAIDGDHVERGLTLVIVIVGAGTLLMNGGPGHSMA